MTPLSKQRRAEKAVVAALEKVFAAEIEGRMYQSKAKIMQRLADEGYVEPAEERFRDRFGTIVCKGWNLTHLGRLTYCLSCDEPRKVHR